MPEITAGIVLVTKFVSSGDSVFSGYIDYINRNNAVRNDNINKFVIPDLDTEIQKYNEYMNYMDDSEKTTELFTADKNRLSVVEKGKLQNVFQLAQDNNSLMWQTVFSFDNRWLAEYGLYDVETKTLSEAKLKEYIRGGMNKILKNEGMENNSVWSAAIHYNTDNIHVHVATVQPIPQREIKILKTLEFDKNWIADNNILSSELTDKITYDKEVRAHKAPTKNYVNILNRLQEKILHDTGKKCALGDYVTINSDGSIEVSFHGDNADIPRMAKLVKEFQQQKGKFKQSTLEDGKSFIVNKILSQSRNNEKIQQLMRDTIIQGMKNTPLIQNADLQHLYFILADRLPTDKRLWQYNRNLINPFRADIDRFVTSWLEQHHNNEFKELQKYLSTEQKLYQSAYGGKNNEYQKNQIQDLYSRLGNIVLKNLKELANEGFEPELSTEPADELVIYEQLTLEEEEEEEKEEEEKKEELSEKILIDKQIKQEEKNQVENEPSENEIWIQPEKMQMNFSKEYKLAKQYLYGTKEIKEDHNKAFSMLSEEAVKGNILAIYDLAYLYDKGIGCNENAALSKSLYLKAYAGFLKETGERPSPRTLSYLYYRIAKMHFNGLGVEKNREEAFSYFNQSNKAVANGYAYSEYYIAKYYETGEIVEKDNSTAFKYYSRVCDKALNGDIEMPHAIFKTGNMLERGIGVSVDIEKANKYYSIALKEFEQSLEYRPDDFIQYRLGKMYLNGQGTEPDETKAMYYLDLSANAGNDMAAYSLAMLYLKDQNIDPQKLEKAKKLLHQAADQKNNHLAQYALGKLYIADTENETSVKKGIDYLLQAAEQKNQYAQYQLGKLYYKGNIFVEPDLQKAINYFTLSAEQDNQFAQYQLSKIYLADTTNESSVKKGVTYLLQAAEQKNQYAQYQLGKLYYKGNDFVKPDLQKAIDYFTLSAKQDNQFAQYQLGKIYSQQKEFEKAIEFFMKAEKQDNIHASYQLGVLYATEKSLLDFKKAEEHLIKAVGHNFSNAEYQLGKLYLSDTTNESNIEKGITYLLQAAEQKNQYAQYQLGKLYYKGNKFVKPDLQKAIDYFTLSAKQDNQFAQYQLGKLYLSDTTNASNIEKGIAYLLQAAKQDNQHAQYQLGKIYSQQKEFEKAIEFFMKAEKQDNLLASYRLGILYANEESIFDFNKAEEHFKKAVGHNFSEAEYQLGKLYLSNSTNEESVKSGINYLIQAAEQKNQYAQYQLGKLYYYGNDFVKPDIDKAFYYLSCSAKQGNTNAQYLIDKANEPINRRTKTSSKIYPVEFMQNFYNLLRNLGMEYRTIENFRNQQKYERLLQEIEKANLER